MKTAFFSLLLALAMSRSAYSQTVGGSLDLEGLLPGQWQIEGASVRPPARAYYLLYAAALDQYMSKKADLLSKEPVLTHLLEREFSIAHLGFTLPVNPDRFPPVVDASREASDLEHFLATGYDGKLRKEIETYIAELRRGAKTK